MADRMDTDENGYESTKPKGKQLPNGRKNFEADRSESERFEGTNRGRN